MNSKQAACLHCRKSKIKCQKEEGATVCKRCEHTGTECVIPEFHIGRQKGVKNKRSGLEKAIFQVEEAIKKRRCDVATSQTTLEHLHKLLGDVQSNRGNFRNAEVESLTGSDAATIVKDSAAATNDEHLALEGAENPLQLLARASDLRIASPYSYNNGPSTPGRKLTGSEPGVFHDVHRFFTPMKATPDQGPGLDPVEVGLVTIGEAEMLLRYFHEKLAHTRWGLDPLVHTLPFVRSRSAFLFTTLLAMAAIFLPEAASLAKRLLLHRRFLAEQVIVKKCRSVEIVLAFMVSIPWMPPGSYAGDDDTSLYLATALSISLDLSLDRIITPSSTFNPDLISKIPKADTLEATRALTMDGFEDVNPKSEWGQRLLRRRERVWISLYVLERGVCLARGRSYCVPKTSLIKYSGRWHYHQYANIQDGPLVSVAVLRTDLDDLFADIRSRCDNYRPTNKGSQVAEDIEKAIEDFFDIWFKRWTSVIGDAESGELPPYVEILVTHKRLSIYGMLLNHPSAPPEVKRSFRASALSSALNVMRAAIQGEARLKSMPNNTVTMICFAANIALALSAPVAGKSGSQGLAPSVRNLIEETATLLERVGSTPRHRNGASVVFGKFLRVLVKQAPTIDIPPPIPSQQPHPPMEVMQIPSQPVVGVAVSPNQQTNAQMQAFWPTTLPFSAMSYNEINQTVSNSDLFSTTLLDMHWNDSNPLWTDWMNLADMNYP